MEGGNNITDTKNVHSSTNNQKNITDEGKICSFKKIEEILYPENVELTNLVSILNIEDFSFTLHDFFNLGCVKNFKLDNSQISSQIKYFNFIEFSKDEKICYLAYDQKVQLFNLFNLSEDVINMKDSEIAENLTLTRKNNSFEVIRYKKCAKENKFTFIISSNENIEASKNYFSNLSFIENHKISIESRTIQNIYDNLKAVYNKNFSYSSETKNLKAEIHDSQKTKSSRHNSGNDNLSWRKKSHENNKDIIQKNVYNSNLDNKKKNSIIKGGNNQNNQNLNNNSKYTRERFNSEGFVRNAANQNNGKYHNPQYQKSFHKNSFSNVNNIYFGKNPGDSTDTSITLTSLNNPIHSVNKNFSNEIEIDTSKIKYPLQIKFKYTENDIEAIYKALTDIGILNTRPEFNNCRQECVSEKRKDLSKYFFTQYSNNRNDSQNNFRDRSNTVQVSTLEAQIKSLNTLITKDSSVEKDNSKKETAEKKRISLNVNSPKFVRKNPEITDIPTFNPLSSINAPFNKFDQYDPSNN